MPLPKVKSLGTENIGGGNRNIVINGAMQVAQRATSATGVGGSNGYFTVDRFGIYQSGTNGRFTMSQASVTDLAGFSNALKLDVTTADTSVAAGELLQLATVFEGQDLQGFKKGYSEAEGYTLSFYVKGTAKTYSVELYDGDNNRHVTKTFSVTTSWNRVVLNFPADTTGKFDNDNALSLYVLFWIHTGTTYSSGSAATTWASVTNANRAVGVESIFSSTDNEFFIPGIQLEVGTQASPFEHRSFGEEQALCQRYFQQWTQEASGFSTNNYAAVCDVVMHGSTLPFMQYVHPTVLRATPSLTFNGNFAANVAGGGDFAISSLQANTSTPYVTSFYGSTGSAGAGNAGYMRANNDGDASIFFDSEL